MNAHEIPKLTAADLHTSVAFTMYQALGVMKNLAAAKILAAGMGEDPNVELPLSVVTTMVGDFITLTVLCLKHGLLDMGAIESVWAEHMSEEDLRSCSKRVTALMPMADSVEISSIQAH